MKTCSRCHLSKDESGFYYVSRSKKQLRPECSQCSISVIRHARKNQSPDERAKRIKRSVVTNSLRRDRNIKYAADYLKCHPCASCGEINVLCLEFHHKDPQIKAAELSKMIGMAYSLHKIKEEIKKCDVLCANCHRILTAHQFNFKILKYL